VLGQRGRWGSSCFWGCPQAHHPTSCRFPDGFEKFSPPILQLDEVDFYYDPKHVIFSRLSVSADLESRICVVWLPSLFCELGVNSPSVEIVLWIGHVGGKVHRSRSQSLGRGLHCTCPGPSSSLTGPLCSIDREPGLWCFIST
jgi:hypothetical protein